MSKFLDLAKKLDRIPHLDLGKKFDVERLQIELDSVDQAMFLPLKTVNERHGDLISRNWQTVSLISPNATLHEDYRENWGPEAMSWTSVAEQLPYIKQTVCELGGLGQRSMLTRVQPGGRLAWHRHNGEATINGDRGRYTRAMRGNWYELIVHVPIRTNPDFAYSVIDAIEYHTFDFKYEPLPVHEKNYPAGEPWAFNGVHVHNVFNRSKTEARYSLMMYLDIRMKKTFDIVSKAVDRYIANGDGPPLSGL